MIPGEYKYSDPDALLTGNPGLATVCIVSNTGDRLMQVGGHYHFYEVNDSLQFDELDRGFR